MAGERWRRLRRPLAVVLMPSAMLAALAVLRPWDGGAGGLRDDVATVARGAAIYAERCASCHGAGLEGRPDWQSPGADGLMPAPPHHSDGHTWHHDDATLFGITKDGLVPPWAPAGYRSNMPGFVSQLTDDEIWAVLSFVASSWGKEQRSWQREVETNAAARR